MKQCPFCAEEIQDAALICRFCNRALAGLPDAPVVPARTPHAPRPTDTVNFARTVAADPVRAGMTLAERYRIAERIGSGGMGDVFLAHDAELADMPVAVKVLPALLARNTPSIEGLKREAAIALRLAHPHICRLHNFHSDGDIKFLVMEHLPGQTLEALLAARPDRQMTWDELRPLAQHLASALDYAHALRPPIVHGDLKPANIMVTPDGMAKLLDFGIAREIRTSLTRITGREETSGTLPYMSPEQFRGETLSAASDLYSFCAVLYEALAGRPLVNPGGSLAWQIQDRPFDPLTGQTAWVNALLAAGLSKNASERPATITALLELAHPPKVVPPPPPDPAPVQPEPTPSASVFPSAPSASVPPPEPTPKPTPTPTPAPMPAPTGMPPKRRHGLLAVALLLFMILLGVTITGVLISNHNSREAAKQAAQIGGEHDAARNAASTANTRALEAQRANAPQDAPTQWHQGEAAQAAAQKDFDTGRYAQAQSGFEAAAAAYQSATLEANIVGQARTAAVTARDTATTAETAAKNAQANQVAPVTWNQAQDESRQAATAFTGRDFAGAATHWQNARAAFGKAQSEAVTAKPKKPDLLAAPFYAQAAKDAQTKWADYLKVQAQVTNTIGMKLMLIPDGTFTMGTPDTEVGKFVDEGPQHKVTLTNAYYLGIHHVTVGQFRQFVLAAGYNTEAEKGDGAFIWAGTKDTKDAGSSWKNVGFTQGDDHPVVCVSWNDAVAFCQWLSNKEKKSYRLPSEAEWEYACRAGTTTAYPWGNNPDDGKGWANCADLTAKDTFPLWQTFNWRDRFVYTSPVGSFKANPLGLYDMIGNAWEWCNDWLGPYAAADQTDPTGPANGSARVLRGGSWGGDPLFCRAGFRIGREPDYRYSGCGFRVVLDSN